jgi:SAM-dependent methyltransferase
MPEFSTVELTSRYWGNVAEEWRARNKDVLWRRHSDAVYYQLLQQWLRCSPVDKLLKTDLFDEAMSEGLVPLLETKANHVVAVDVSAEIAEMAATRYADLEVRVADVRALPFEDASFDTIVSLSTLDHFEIAGDIVNGLQELYRVLRPGGQLLLTMDNLANPAVWLRNALPFSLLHQLGIVPYYVGQTCGPRRLKAYVRRAGFSVLEMAAVMHCPRVLAVLAARLLTKCSRPTHARYLQVLSACERLQSWPTRYLTGYFTAIRAQKDRSDDRSVEVLPGK